MKPPTDREPSKAAIHHSYWLRRKSLTKRFLSLDTDHKTDVLVIGAGITGLSIALELLLRGLKVSVCESNTLGAGTTGGSSGHLDAHPEMRPGQLVQHLGKTVATAYTRMRLDAIDRIEARCDEQCGFKRIPAYFYTERPTSLDAIRDDLAAAQEIGLSAKWVDSVPIDYAVGGYRIDGMARIDSLAYLLRLAALVQEQGGEIFEQTIVTGPTEDYPRTLQSSGGKIEFEHVVCTTHCNYTDSHRLYLQTPAYQSYVMAVNVASPLEDALFWDDSHPYYYVRTATLDRKTILAGGKDHRTGDGDAMAALSELENWVRQRFDVQEVVSRWSAELFESTDGLPFIGKVAGKENVWAATGLSGVGLTLGTAAGPMIADLLEGKTHKLQDLLAPSRTSIQSTAKALAEQVTTARDLLERVLPAKTVNVEELQPGEGTVGNVDGTHTAACRDQHACVHQLSPICTHMGGVLRWNPVEQTWDCPVHGGRFAADGKRLYGPPENDLTRYRNQFGPDFEQSILGDQKWHACDLSIASRKCHV